MKRFFSICLYLVSIATLHAGPPMSDEEKLKWFESDEMRTARDINEGTLVFLPQPDNQDILHSMNVLDINESSIDTGWVDLHQCYRNLDAVPEAEVVYRYRHMRNLAVESYTNIRQARAEGQSVQLQDVKNGANLCITAEVRIFYQNEDKTYSLVNGPFHRRFLDGFYPYHVTLTINYPEKRLKLFRTRPEPQPGYQVVKSKNQIVIDAYFEGILDTETIFLEHSTASGEN